MKSGCRSVTYCVKQMLGLLVGLAGLVLADKGKSLCDPRPLPITLTGDRHTAKHAPDRRSLVTTYGHWEQGEVPDLKSVCFRLNEVDSMAESAWCLDLTGDALRAAELRLARPFGSHMVMPMEKRVPVWGHAAAGQKVVVEFAGQLKSVKAADDGSWELWLDAMECSADGREMTVRSRGEELVCEDVLVGVVWFCSGQSNMDFPLSQAVGGREEAASAGALKGIRLMNLTSVGTGGRKYNDVELGRLTPERLFEGKWERVSQGSALAFSAVGWWAGKVIYEKLGVPVGLVDNSVGGSGAEAWLPRESLKARKDYAELLGAQWIESEMIGSWAKGRAKLNLGGVADGNHPFRPGFLFESGVRWWQDFPFSGVLWYQGETNAEIHDDKWNERMITDLITGWRKVLGQPELPWVMVQLPRIGGNDPMRKWWPDFRAVQASVAKQVKGVELVVTEDLGWDSPNVHPPDKKPVGMRLGEKASGGL